MRVRSSSFLRWALVPFLVIQFGVAFGGTDSVLLLYTCDLHDHVRPGYNGLGGIPYVAGFVKQARQKRPDILLVDAGDVTEKGDLVAFSTQSTLTYKAIGKIGYQAITVGNHDWNYGPDFLRNCQLLAGKTKLLCANLLEGNRLAFVPSAVFEIDGVKVGVVGLARPDEIGWDKTIQNFREECARLEPLVHFTVAVCHMSVDECLRLAREAPVVDVFVAGHSHDQLESPLLSKETGAFVVQADCYAKQVGWLDLTVDLEARKITRADGRLIPMEHSAVPVDQAMLDWVLETERRECPEARRPVAHSNRELTLLETARLGAAALRTESKADMALVNAQEIIRSEVPRGPIDFNAIFLTDGQRARRVFEVELPGAVIEAYLNHVARSGRPMPQVEGRPRDSAANQASTISVWEPDRAYRLVLPERQWRNSLQPFLLSREEAAQTKTPEPATCPFTFVEALARYCEKVEATGVALDDHVKSLQGKLEPSNAK